MKDCPTWVCRAVQSLGHSQGSFCQLLTGSDFSKVSVGYAACVERKDEQWLTWGWLRVSPDLRFERVMATKGCSGPCTSWLMAKARCSSSTLLRGWPRSENAMLRLPRVTAI